MSDLPDFDQMWDYNEPEKTESKFRELLPIAKNSKNHEYLAQLLTQIARAQGLQRKFDDAHQTLDGVKTLLNDGTLVAQIRYFLERGRVYNSSKDINSARPLFNQAWELARDTREDFYAVDAAHMLGICEVGDSSLKWNERAMATAEVSEDPRTKSWLGSLYNNIGWTYHNMEQYERALELFGKGLSWRQERGNNMATRIAKWTVARTLRSLGRVDEALKTQELLIKEHEEAGTTGPFVFEEMGECLLLLGKPDEAHSYFARAYELLSKDAWLKDNEPDRFERLKNLAKKKEC